MKKISSWAMYHAVQARLIMLLIKIVLFFLALYTGNQLQEQGIYFSDKAFSLVLLFFIVAVFIYPDKRQKKVYFEYRYYIRQKINDFIIALCSFFILIITFNTNLFSQLHNSAHASIVFPERNNNVVVPGKDGKQEKLSIKEWRKLKAGLKKQLKRLVITKPGESGTGKNKGWKLALAIFSGVVLTALLAALACSIACNGSEVVAVIIAAVGLTGIIFGLIAWIKSIYRKRSIVRRRGKRKMNEPVITINMAK
ncbi:hypothetical protein DC498_22370 [Terrimonas sp.]|uniref:hypothetical protein n=1 Tax=Terrimonas sp. TaxID=1914338 RepID=UPI000D51BC6B|nr:hypothetical protein [Terrimonas sp.]PVD49726.1 hypothetical protein DC498_23535 [Terrimonas sp.]PVD49960.1 hypothetical protein DC498_22370 [Terrimonas sp.]